MMHCYRHSRRLLSLLVLVVAIAATFAANDDANAAVHASPVVHSADDNVPDVPECPREFTRDYQPVCASNGRLYVNKSVLKYQQCRATALGQTALKQEDMSFCTGRDGL